MTTQMNFTKRRSQAEVMFEITAQTLQFQKEFVQIFYIQK
jgi:hypothetical protein